MATNPNPARITTQMWALWEGFDVIEPSTVLGGIYAPKTGYHDTRMANPSGNYSVVLPVDKEGPDDKAAAIDLTFPDAQAKPPNYATINKYSNRLYAAGKAGRTNDPRTIYMREFYGNIDTDREVEGWDYHNNRPATSDSSHLWHIHISIHRKYVNDPEMTRAILSILKGETVDEWRGGFKEEDDDVRGLILQDPSTIVLYFNHPTTGELVWTNIMDGSLVDEYQKLGWVHVNVSPKTISQYGRDLALANKELLDAMSSGDGGTAPLPPLTGNFTFNGAGTVSSPGSG